MGCSLPYVHFLFINTFFSLSLSFLSSLLLLCMCVHACVWTCMCASVCHLLFDTWIFMFSNNNTVIGYFIGEVLHVLIRTLVWHWDGGLLQGSIWHFIVSNGGNVNDNQSIETITIKIKMQRNTAAHDTGLTVSQVLFFFFFFFSVVLHRY